MNIPRNSVESCGEFIYYIINEVNYIFPFWTT